MLLGNYHKGSLMTPGAVQGGLANSSGKALEGTIKATMQSKGFTVVPFRKWEKDQGKYGSELLLTNVPYETIYGHRGTTEFLIRSERYNLEIRVECKWQQSSGSVDEKFPYVYLNCVEKMPEATIFIVVDGGGAKSGASIWLRKACASRLFLDGRDEAAKKIHVFTLMEFLVWANATLR
jgi:hypothetical protein